MKRVPRIRAPESYVPPLLAFLCASFTFLLMSAGVFDTYELHTYDVRCQWRPPRDPGDHVFLLVVDDGILLHGGFGTFPWPRGVWAALQRDFVDPLRPHSVVYDILFDQAEKGPDRPLSESDAAFARVIDESGNVFLAMSFLLPSLRPVSATEMLRHDADWFPPSRRFARKYALDPELVSPGDYYHATGLIAPFQDFERAARGLGHVNTPPDPPDKITRRYPLLMEYAGDYFPSLPLAVVCDFAGADLKTVRVFAGDRIAIPARGGRTLSVPIDRRGNLLLNYYGEDITVFPSLSMTRFLEAADPAKPDARERADLSRIGGNILLVGSTAASTHDLRPTAMNELYPLVGNVATAVANILRGDFLRRTGTWTNAFLLVLIASLFTEISLRTQRCLEPLFARVRPGSVRLALTIGAHTVPAAAMGAAYVAAAFFVFGRFSRVLPMFYGLLCLGLTLVILTVYNFFNEEQNKRWFEQTWGRYMSPDMIQQLRRNPEQLHLGGEEREITLLFTDIKGFTPLSEKLSPAEVVQLLNEHFDAMVEIVHANRGMLDKFIGDALMVHFGSPRPAPDDALRAVKTGLEMQARMRDISAERQRDGRPPILVRIGVNTGRVIAGNIGSYRRQEYTAIGDPVNVAQRLEANCPPGGVLISRSTFERVRDSVVADPLDPLRVKGRTEAVEVYLVKGLRPGPSSEAAGEA